MRPALTALVLIAAAAAPAAAQAQDASPWSFEIGAATDNRSKDASKTNGEPYVFAGAEWAPGPFYLGAGVQTIDAGGSNVEAEWIVGARRSLGGTAFDVFAARKMRVDADPGYDAEAWEITADATRAVGPVKARLRLQHSPDGTGSVRAWTWTSLRLSHPLREGLSLSAEVGHREQDGAPDYTGANVGVTWSATERVALDLRYHATDENHSGRQYADRLVLRAVANF